MRLTERPLVGRAAALTLLALLIVLFFVGPFAAYSAWIGDTSDTLADRVALLQRYRALAAGDRPVSASTPTGPALLYPEMPESQASAMLQETVKNTAQAAHVQVQGLQVLHAEAMNGMSRIGVRVRGSGDMASIRGLVYAIETARPVLYADNLSIQSHGVVAGTTPETLDFQLDISGFKTEPRS